MNIEVPGTNSTSAMNSASGLKEAVASQPFTPVCNLEKIILTYLAGLFCKVDDKAIHMKHFEH